MQYAVINWDAFVIHGGSFSLRFFSSTHENMFELSVILVGSFGLLLNELLCEVLRAYTCLISDCGNSLT